MNKHHSSLNPEFDEANAAILADMEKPDLKCDFCGEGYYYSAGDKAGEFCGKLVVKQGYKIGCTGVLKSTGTRPPAKYGDGLVCERCGVVYEINVNNKPGYYCTQKFRRDGKEVFCDGQIRLEKNVIKLPDKVKNGKNDYHTGTGYQTTWESHKHYGDKVIFEHEGKKIYASNGHSLNEKSGNWGLIIDLAGVVPTAKATNFIREDAPPRFKELKSKLDKDEALPSEVLRLFWNDMSVPPAGIEFWLAMWPMLPEKTVIACQGGHGRTGTAIASLMIAAGVDYYSALDDVRKEHCNKAVETLGQEQYLHCIYLEYLNHMMSEAKAANDLNEVKDITEDIEYAMKNKPTFQVKSYNTQDKKIDPVVDTKKPGGDNKSVVPFVESTKGGATTGNPAEDEILDKHTKIVGDKIMVEECTDMACTDANCENPEHMAWVEWDWSQTEVW